jgi:hypothetical protein
MFHDKTELPGDRQYWYKINATGMDQKGVKMDFLWIKQDFGIIFIIKNIFYINLPNLLGFWTARIIFEKFMVYSAKFRASA